MIPTDVPLADVMVPVLTAVLTAATAAFGWLRVRDRNKVRSLERKVEALERSDTECKREVRGMRQDMTATEVLRVEERDKFESQLRSMEKDRYDLTFANNTLLVDKMQLMERITQMAGQLSHEQRRPPKRDPT